MARSDCLTETSVRVEAVPKIFEDDGRPMRAGTEERRNDEAGGASGSVPPLSLPRAPSPLPNLAGLTVLVVDDDESSRDYFATALGIAGAVVVTAPTAIDALRVAQERHPNAVLSDIAMPGHDGYWLVSQIHDLPDPALRAVPVVATTAFGRVHSKQRAIAAGFADYLSKPVDPGALCATMGRVVGRAS